MQKVVSISLNGNSYQLEEPGYEQLRAYLERAESRLKDSPDRAEVMADLEQAVSEKCRATLGPHKTVVSTLEVERIISEMGPVESADEKSAHADTEGGCEWRHALSRASPQAPVPHQRRRHVGRRVQWHCRVPERRRDLGAYRLRAAHHLQLRGCGSWRTWC